MAEDKKLNGSVDLLAQAMRKVFDETVAPLSTEIKAVRTEVCDTEGHTNPNKRTDSDLP